jgi:hypothetical protein
MTEYQVLKPIFYTAFLELLPFQYSAKVIGV